MRFALAVLAALLAQPLYAADCQVKSGPGTAALVELYTSEGCNSCPPADDWLRQLRVLNVVPLSLHVDYWDYIGWKDPFAQPAFAARQREMVSLVGGRVVYTPQVMLAGRDYRGWTNRARFENDVRAVNGKPARAAITLAFKANAVMASASVADVRDRSEAVLYVATYENGLSNSVTAGENKGVTLRHDYVVREWFGPYALGSDGRAEMSRSLARAGSSGAAAFVQSRHTGEILQVAACAG